MTSHLCFCDWCRKLKAASSLAVCYFMESRDPTQLIYRWSHVLDPSLKKGPWTKEEDQVCRGRG